MVISIAIGSASQNDMSAFDQDRHRVRADRHEAGLAEVEDGEAHVHLEAEREDQVGAGEDAHAGPEAEVSRTPPGRSRTGPR